MDLIIARTAVDDTAAKVTRRAVVKIVVVSQENVTRNPTGIVDFVVANAEVDSSNYYSRIVEYILRSKAICRDFQKCVTGANRPRIF